MLSTGINTCFQTFILVLKTFFNSSAVMHNNVSAVVFLLIIGKTLSCFFPFFFFFFFLLHIGLLPVFLHKVFFFFHSRNIKIARNKEGLGKHKDHMIFIQKLVLKQYTRDQVEKSVSDCHKSSLFCHKLLHNLFKTSR